MCKGEYFASRLNPRATARSSKETWLIALMRKPPRDSRRLVHAIFIVNSTVDNKQRGRDRSRRLTSSCQSLPISRSMSSENLPGSRSSVVL
jgi:hypothetical protein